MSLIIGPDGYVYDFNDSVTHNKFVKKSNLSATLQTLPGVGQIPLNIISSSVHSPLFKTLEANDPDFALFLKRNPQLIDLLDASVSRGVKAATVSDFIRQNPSTREIYKQKLISLSQDLPFYTLMNSRLNVSGMKSVTLEKLNRLLGDDIYNRLVEQNLYTSNLSGLLRASFTDSDIAQMKGEGISVEQLAPLLANILPLESEPQIEAQLQELYNVPQGLPVDSNVLGSLPISTTRDVGDNDIYLSGGGVNTLNYEQKTREPILETRDQQQENGTNTDSKLDPIIENGEPIGTVGQETEAGQGIIDSLQDLIRADNLSRDDKLKSMRDILQGTINSTPSTPTTVEPPSQPIDPEVAKDIDTIIGVTNETLAEIMAKKPQNQIESQAAVDVVSGQYDTLEDIEKFSRQDPIRLVEIERLQDEIAQFVANQANQFGVDQPTNPIKHRSTRLIPPLVETTGDKVKFSYLPAPSSESQDENSVKVHTAVDHAYTSGSIGRGLYRKVKEHLAKKKTTTTKPKPKRKPRAKKRE